VNIRVPGATEVFYRDDHLDAGLQVPLHGVRGTDEILPLPPLRKK
jgi:hypothetical protein